MAENRIPNQTGEWLKGTGRESDIVISSRVRLARNAAGYPFVNQAGPRQHEEVDALLRNAILEARLADDMVCLEIPELDPLDRALLVERHLISREHAQGEGKRSVLFGKGEMISLMVNEEDHLRIQVIHSGFELKEAWNLVSGIDDKIEETVSYAFSPDYGYLTACPTNVGTGLRVSVMLHLPALVLSREIEKVFNAVAKIDLTVRGLYGEGTQALGDFYQISNQKTLGKSEEEIMGALESVIPHITGYERRVRQALIEQDSKQIEDQVWRAYGILRYAQAISSEETMHLLSQLRMGVNLGLLPDMSIAHINRLFTLIQPAHLQSLAKRELDTDERNVMRADFLRNHVPRVSGETPPRGDREAPADGDN